MALPSPKLGIKKLDIRIFHEICDDLRPRWREFSTLMEEKLFQLPAHEIEAIALATHRETSHWNCASDLLYKLGDSGMKVKDLIKYLDKLRMERVLLMLKLPENLVILDHPSLFIKIKQGDTLRIKMHANGFPYPRYTWFKNPQDVVGMEENEDGILEIEDAQPTDAGFYCCRVWRNSMPDQILWGNDGRWTQVTVVEQPAVEEFKQQQRNMQSVLHTRHGNQMNVGIAGLCIGHPGERLSIVTHPVEHDDEVIRVDYNGEVTLRCVAAGSPAPEYQWTLNGAIINSPEAKEPTYVINQCQENQQGTYQCRVRNDLHEPLVSKKASLQVITPVDKERGVRITQQPSSMTVEKGTCITFSVRAEGFQPLHYKWYYNNKPIQDANKRDYQIPMTEMNHGGSYQCQVSARNKENQIIAEEMSYIAKLSVDFQTSKPQPVKQKWALIIGISPETGKQKLPCVINDIIRMTRIFEEMDFKVFSYFTLSLHEMRVAINLFTAVLGEDCYGVIYLVGHGVYIAGQHYLLASNPYEGFTLENSTICCEEILTEALKKKPKLLVAFFDMCRRTISRLQSEGANSKCYDLKDEGNLIVFHATSRFREALEPIVQGKDVEHMDELMMPVRFPNSYGVLCKYLEKSIQGEKYIPDLFKQLQDEIRESGESEIQIPNLENNLLEWRKSLCDPVTEPMQHHDKWAMLHGVTMKKRLTLATKYFGGEQQIILDISFARLLTNVLLITIDPQSDQTRFPYMRFFFDQGRKPRGSNLQYTCEQMRANSNLVGSKTVLGGLQRVTGDIVLHLIVEVDGETSKTIDIDVGKPLVCKMADQFLLCHDRTRSNTASLSSTNTDESLP